MNDILEYRGYNATLYFSAVDDVFHGKVIGINDLITFECGSVKELKKALTEAVDDYLQTCKTVKKSPDKPYKGSFNVRISSDLHREAAIAASLKNMSLNDFVKNAIHFTLSKLNHDSSSGFSGGLTL